MAENNDGGFVYSKKGLIIFHPRKKDEKFKIFD